MQVRLRFGFGTRSPLRRSRVSRERNAGEIAFWIVPRNPLQRSCVSRADWSRATSPLRRSRASRAQNAGEMIAFWIYQAQPSAEIVPVEGAKCR